MKENYIRSCLAFIMLLACKNAFADIKFGNLYYNILSETDLTAEVSSNLFTSGDVVIAPEIEFNSKIYKVISIRHGAFLNSNDLTSVSIPNTIKTIGDHAFQSCRSIRKIIIPNSVTSIDEAAFIDCINLTDITLSNNLESISNYIFEGCKSLSSISIPNSVTSIGDRAFFGCESLTSIEIPNSVISIGDNAFSYCINAASISIPNSVTSIGDNAFKSCSALKSIFIPKSLTLTIDRMTFRDCRSLEAIDVADEHPNYSSFDGCLYTKDYKVIITCPRGKNGNVTIHNNTTDINEYTFNDCSNVTSISFSNSITKIGDYAFFSCTSLTSITLPNSVTTVGTRAFLGCDNLKYVSIPNSVTQTIDKFTFAICMSLETIDVAEENPVYASYDGLLYTKDFETLIACPQGKKGDISIKDKLKVIKERAFESCPYITTIALPNTLSIIEDGAFSNCENLKSIQLPNSLSSIGNYAFSYCVNLTSISLPNSLKSISRNLFKGCCNLKSIFLPKSITSIGDNAFWECSALTSVYCNWEEPFECNPSFPDEVLQNAILYVPVGYSDNYNKIKPWSGFVNITEMAYSGLDDGITTKNSLKISVENGNIIINGISENLPVTIYDIQGRIIHNGTEHYITNIPSGNYIIKIGLTTTKIAI